jgi:hypothetical protein
MLYRWTAIGQTRQREIAHSSFAHTKVRMSLFPVFDPHLVLIIFVGALLCTRQIGVHSEFLEMLPVLVMRGRIELVVNEPVLPSAALLTSHQLMVLPQPFEIPLNGAP